MKSVLRNAMLLLILVGGYQSAKAQTPDVAQLLRDVEARYASLQSYSATGEVLSSITTARSNETRNTFTITLARPQMYKILWETKSGPKGFFFSSKGAVWSDGEKRFVNVAGQTKQPSDTTTALAMATGVSRGAANTIPSIFFNLSNNVLTAASNAVLSGEELVDGDDCYVVKVHSDLADRTFWISKTSRLIRQEMTNGSGGSVGTTELSEIDATQALEAMGRKVTDKEIHKLRDRMADAQRRLKSVKSYYSIERHRDIKINDPLSRGDFRQE